MKNLVAVLFIQTVVCLAALSVSAENEGYTDKKRTNVKYRKAPNHKIHHAVKAPVIKSKPVAVPAPIIVKTPHCPDGYELSGKDCVSRHEVPETHSCPGGSNEHNGECRVRLPAANLYCPPDFELQGKVCSSEERAPEVNICPNGSHQHGNRCVIKLEHTAYCPAGAARIGDQCARFTPLVKECPAGYTPRGDLCATQVFEEPDSVCPAGTTPDGHLCTITTSIDEVCPPGTVDVGDRCASYNHKKKECPKGYSFSGKSCIRTERAPKISICANGGDPDENCIIRIPVPPSPYCKIGKLCTTGQCKKPKRSRPVYTCPAGYELQHGTAKCVKVTTYDCTATHQDIECAHVPHVPSHEKLSSAGKGYITSNPHVRHRLLGVDHKGKYQSISYSKLGTMPKCQKKTPAEKKMCEKVHTATPEGYCAEGTFKGTYCETYEFFEPEYRCDAQTDHHGNCFVEERTPLLYTCPSGYTKTSDGCVRTEMEIPRYFCPPGTIEPNCATFVEKVCPGGKCVHHAVEAPKLICPEGYHMIERQDNFTMHKKSGHHHKHFVGNDKGHHMDTPKCTKTMFAEKSSACPRGTVATHDLKCASYVDITVEQADRTVAMQQSCPTMYTHKGGSCVKEVTVPAEVECPHDSFPFGYDCIKTVPQVSSCPMNAIRETGRCYALSIVTPIMVESSCSYDTSKSSCKYKASKSIPKHTSVKTPTYKHTKHYGGPLQVKGKGY